VGVGFTAAEAGSYMIALDNFDALFQNQDILLHDKALEVYHNLKGGAYSFVTAAGTFDQRFEIVYRDAGALGVGEYQLGNDIVVFKDAAAVKIISSRSSIQSVQVSDMQGRIIYTKKNIGATNTVLDGLSAERQVLIVTITTEDNKKVSKKIIF